MNAIEAVEIIQRRFAEIGSPTQVPLLRGGGSFTVELTDEGFMVNNLGNQPFLPWAVFAETISLLIRQGGIADRGNAQVQGIRLGDEGLSLESVEGHIAHVVYGRQLGQTVFRRITPIACILIWTGICEHEPGRLKLRDFSGLKATGYFKHIRQRPDRSRIQDDWLVRVIQFADKAEVQADGRIRKWAWIPEEGKFLRVILLEDGETIHNAFFDRSYKESKQ
jgi:hypothetical protein